MYLGLVIEERAARRKIAAGQPAIVTELVTP
jgi:hypothetical protein